MIMFSSSSMKKNLFILFFLLLSFVSISQNKSKYFAEVKGGLSLPVGGFSNKSYTGGFLDQADGLAKTGPTAGFTAGYHFKKSLAAVVSFGYSNNQQDAAAYNDYLRKSLGNDVSTAIITNAWSVFKITGGGYFETAFSTGSEFFFRSNIQAGICKTSIPGFKYTYATGTFPDQQAGTYMIAKIDVPWAFCYNAGAGIKYKLSGFYLLADVNYFGSTPIHKYSYMQTFPNPGPLVNAEKKMSLSSINLVAGAGIEF